MVEGSGRRIRRLRRRNYRLSIAMGEGFGETLARDMGKRLENHLSNGRPLQREEAMLVNISLWAPHTHIQPEYAHKPDQNTYLAIRIMKRMQVHLTTLAVNERAVLKDKKQSGGFKERGWTAAWMKRKAREERRSCGRNGQPSSQSGQRRQVITGFPGRINTAYGTYSARQNKPARRYCVTQTRRILEDTT